MQILVIGLLVWSGSMIAVQSVANAALSRGVGLPFFAVVFSLIQLFLVSLGYVIWGQPSRISSLLVSLSAFPYTYYLGAVLGGVILSAMAFGFSKVGALVAVAAVVLGQLGMGLVLDHFGWLGTPVQEVTWLRILGVMIITLGVWMVR